MMVSIIVPCFNQGNFLADLIASVDDACTFQHEIIIVNDGSTDELTQYFLGKIRPQSKKQHISVMNLNNGGLSYARNQGLDLAQGKYVQFLDADDLVTKGKIDFQLEELENNESLSVHLTEYVYCNQARSRFWRHHPSTIDGFNYDTASFIENWERGLTVPIHCALIRRSAMDGIRFNETLKGKEDWIFWIALASRGLQFKYSGFVGAIYRQHGLNMCRNDREMALNWLRAVQYLLGSGVPISDEAKEGLVSHYNSWYLKFFTRANDANLVNSMTNQSALNFLFSRLE
ncbi:putative glycosyltransferase EpsJ [mine drainage metagenome]|uniref:Putative glycosyltransferase EpsJ n=1 Tax=mine drainage metagenome TaxID=410659 RepID=A0A1J5Q9M5_9ZZZZ